MGNEKKKPSTSKPGEKKLKSGDKKAKARGKKPNAGEKKPKAQADGPRVCAEHYTDYEVFLQNFHKPSII